MSLISVIVTTYNWPDALAVCLQSLFEQYDQCFEIIIADDGSSTETGQLIGQLTLYSTIPIKHIYHADLGFRAGTIRNKAVAESRGEYLIFLDGDCTTLPHFIKRHRQLAEKEYFVPGNRILLSPEFTHLALKRKIALHNQSLLYFLLGWLTGKVNRISPLLLNPFLFLRYLQPTKWEKAMTCNLGLFKKDFIAVNGFDEHFEGWGYEDSDLVIRLIHNGIRRKEGRFALPVLHHWHKENDRSKHDENFQRLQERLDNNYFIRAERGVDQYL
jgi:glycosyltransferase involved in cell wall biosynthesis